MNSWRSLTPSHWLFVSLLAIVVAIVLWVGASLMLSAYQINRDVSRLQPQIARLQGLASTENEFASKAELAKNSLQGLIYQTGSDATALGNTMQQALRSEFDQAGLLVSGSQLLPVSREDSLTRLRLRINATGELGQLTQLLLALADYKPVVVIDQFEVKPERRRRNNAEQLLDISMTVSSFAVEEG